MSDERKHYLCDNSSIIERPLPAEDRVKSHVQIGNPDIVAHMVLNELSYLPVDQQRTLVAEAAEKHAALAVEYFGTDSDYSRAKVRQAKMLRRSRKEDRAWEKQLKSVYRFARSEL